MMDIGEVPWDNGLPDGLTEGQRDKAEWAKQREERRRLNRSAKISLTRSYHTCGDSCKHVTSRQPPKARKETTKPQSWFQKYAELELVEVGAGSPEVNEVPKANQDANFEVISVTVDSGAFNTVGPPKVGTYFNLTPTEASAQGKHYRAANGSIIRNHGQRVVTGRTEEGTLVSMPIQVADVSKVLGSVREMVKSGNRVVFDEDSNGNCISFLECRPLTSGRPSESATAPTSSTSSSRKAKEEEWRR